MEKGCYVKDIAPSQEIGGVFVVGHAVKGSARNGRLYWRLSLCDASGSLEATIWHPRSLEFDDIPVGAIAFVEGRGEEYRGQVQLAVTNLRLFNAEESSAVDQTALLPLSPRDPDAMLEELEALLGEEFTHAPWRKLVFSVLKKDTLRRAFRIWPAAKSIHHAYAGGLLEHTLGVLALCRSIADHYPELDRQTLLAGALFHDIGKIREYSGGMANDYTTEGRLLGHLELGLELLEPYLADSGLEEHLQRHLKHLVLSHHGEPEYGAARLPQTAEAFALHYADNLDAKMAQCRNLFAQLAGDGRQWTPWQQTLGRQLHKVDPTPVPETILPLPGMTQQDTPFKKDELFAQAADRAQAYCGDAGTDHEQCGQAWGNGTAVEDSAGTSALKKRQKDLLSLL